MQELEEAFGTSLTDRILEAREGEGPHPREIKKEIMGRDQAQRMDRYSQQRWKRFERGGGGGGGGQRFVYLGSGGMLPQENFCKIDTLRLLLRPLLPQSGTYSYHSCLAVRL